jgi:cobalamin-dependent methionine synthase I
MEEFSAFDFPRSSKAKNLCLTDHFGENDIAAFQAVTGQIIPDQSTGAIVVHHPEAEYFVL